MTMPSTRHHWYAIGESTIAPRVLAFALALAAMPVAQAANHEVLVGNNFFNPAELTIAPGDTVTWRNTGGFHNVAADDGSFRSGAATAAMWTYSHTFNAAGTYGYYCEPHGSPGGVGMAARVIVGGAPTFVINEGVQGSWLHPGYSSQGMFFDVSPSLELFGIAWFTWTTTPGQYDWLTGVGPYANGVADITFQRSRGGVFNSDAPTTTTTAGTGTLTFTACDRATLVYTLTDPPRSGSIELLRLLPVSPLCTAANPTADGED